MQTTAILVAAGPGTRLQAGQPKAFVQLGGVPLFIRTLQALTAAPTFACVVIVVPPDERARASDSLERHGPWPCPISITDGGAERQDSVNAGLRQVDKDTEVVAVHDAARPFVTVEVIESVVAAAVRYGAAIAASPVNDTVKYADEDGRVESTLPRERVWLAQTPQAFRTEILRAAHEQAARTGALATDDAALVERIGLPVYIVPSNPENRKITTIDDRRWAEWLLARLGAPR